MNDETAHPVVRTPAGLLRGRWLRGVAAFRGVPYAEPPTGAGRFRPARPAAPWPGVRDADRPGPAAPQPPSRLVAAMGEHPVRQDEDCLTLNVWTPAPDGARPVLVFLHGGGFSSGSGGLDVYDGARPARRGDVVVVTVNYRLGALGFLALDAPNLGLHDEVLALRWVRDTIAAFGGDPDAVTVAGQSAGAISIVAMLSGGSATGLFRRAVLQSTPGGMAPQTPAVAADRVAGFRAALGDGLRDRPVADLLAVQRETTARHLPRLGSEPPLQLVVEPGVVAADPIAEVGARGADGVTVLLGTTRDEAGAFFPGGDRAAAVTESMFAAPARRLAGLLAAAGNPAYVYRLDWCPDGSPFGACHCLELPFLLGTAGAWADAPMLAGARPGEIAGLTDVVTTAWLSFVRTGDPSWPVHRGHGAPVASLTPGRSPA